MIYILLFIIIISYIIYVGVRYSVTRKGMMHADALQTLWPLECHKHSERSLPLSLYISKLVLKEVREFERVIKLISKTYIFHTLLVDSPSSQTLELSNWNVQADLWPGKKKALGCWYLFLINPEKLSKFQGTGGEPERTEKLTYVITGLKGS